MAEQTTSKRLKNTFSSFVPDLISCSINKHSVIASVKTEESANKILNILNNTNGVYINATISAIYEEIDIFDENDELIDFKVTEEIDHYMISAKIARQ